MKLTRNGVIFLDDRKFSWECDIKEGYLKTIKPSTARTVKVILLKVDEYEKEKSKSIYDLNTEEIDDLMETKFNFKSLDSAGSTKSYIDDYINFCINTNLVKHKENRFSLITQERLESYVNAHAMDQKYLTKEEIRQAQDMLYNPCDKLVLELVPLGIRGRTQKGNTCEELINLREKDVDFEKKQIVLLNNDGEKRLIKNVEEHTLSLIKDTLNQKSYISNNGMKIPNIRHGVSIEEYKVFPINETEYVFRNIGKNKYGQVTPLYFNSRMTNIIKKHIKNPYINITNLYFSGMIDYANQLSEEKGTELDSQDYIEICEKFNYGEPKFDPNTGKEIWTHVIYKIKRKYKAYLKAKEGVIND